MTLRSVTYLKAVFETGDIPTGTDYSDLMDSFVSLHSSAAQTMLGTLNSPAIEATRVSAVTVSAQVVHITGYLHNSYADINSVGTAIASAAIVSGDVSLVTCTAAGERAVVLNQHNKGRKQYIINNPSSVTAVTVYPLAGKNFIGTAESVGLLLTAGQTMQIIHVGTSAYSYQRY